MTKPPVVALINSSPDVVDMVRITMEHAGIVLVGTMTHEIRDGEVDIANFVRQHQPQVILYDVAPLMRRTGCCSNTSARCRS